ncbi:MAG: hypothetical protein QW667_00725 [Candidatus Bathyarchaeia archaeon]
MHFDVAMPIALFAVALVAVLLEEKVGEKLKSTLEKRELSVWDAILIVAAISAMVFVVAWKGAGAMIMLMFLFSYSMLLFTFTYAFSNFSKIRAQIFCLIFILASFTAATASAFNIGFEGASVYGAICFFGLGFFALASLLHEKYRKGVKERWYLAILPPAFFVCIYLFFSGFLTGSMHPLWDPYLLDVFGIIFAVLIILYIGSLFTWKATIVFAVLLTVVDIILVLVSGVMVSAAKQTYGLGLPVLIKLPVFPLVITEQGMQYMLLGLGDFFFTGLLAIQTHKRFGKRLGVFSVAAMAISFFVFETFLLVYRLGPFPGTLMIICGWAPIVLFNSLKKVFFG